MQTINEFLKTHSVQFQCVQVPDRDDIDWPADGSSHYVCVLIYAGQHMLTYFSMGSAHRDPPGTADALDCLASDAISMESERTIAGWCSEFGYSEDSRRARRIFKICRRQTKKLKRLLGAEAYTALLFETECL